jgi:hypothetical protein
MPSSIRLTSLGGYYSLRKNAYEDRRYLNFRGEDEYWMTLLMKKGKKE